MTNYEDRYHAAAAKVQALLPTAPTPGEIVRELERAGWHPASSEGADLITAERDRQVTEEGYTAEHDAGRAHALVAAALCYARAGTWTKPYPPLGWPWADQYWKPTGDPVRDLTKAGALIAAAIDSHLAGWTPSDALPGGARGRDD